MPRFVVPAVAHGDETNPNEETSLEDDQPSHNRGHGNKRPSSRQASEEGDIDEHSDRNRGAGPSKPYGARTDTLSDPEGRPDVKNLEHDELNPTDDEMEE